MADIWEFAKEIEVQGKAFYEKMANDTAIEELAGAFHFLAGEEQRHYNIFDSLQKGIPAPDAKAGQIGDVKSAFEKLSKSFEKHEVIEDSESAYEKARSLEEKSIEYYQEVLSKVSDPAQKAAVETILAQEKKHAEIVDSLKEFVKRPKRWLENAEWYHLDRY